MGEEGEEGGVTKRRAANKRRRVTSSTEMFIFYYFFVGNEQRAPLLLQFTRAFYFYLSLSLSSSIFCYNFTHSFIIERCQRCYFSFQLIRFWRIERSLQIDFGGAFDSSIHRSCNTMCIITTKLGKERKYSDPSRLTSRLENISTRNPAIISFRL